MDAASLASAIMAARTSQIQMAVAAKMMKINADAAKSVADLIDAASQNMNRLANVAASIGQNLDISA
jgi:hypothetical protein